MLATPISGVGNPGEPRQFRFIRAFPQVTRCIWVATVVLLLTVAQSFAQLEDTRPPAPADFAKKAEQAFAAAKAKLDSSPNDAEALWQFARASFDWADYATNNDKRATIAQQGINAARKLVEKDSSSVPGHYYLAMNLGELARTKNLGALKLVSQMESEFQIVLARSPTNDFAGPDRNLGLLYRDAPGWPMSIGNNAKARQHLQDALKLARDYPDNWLNLIETEIKWGEKTSAARELKSLDDIWADAKKKFAGAQWDASWADWDKRREDARKAITGLGKSTQAPRK